MHTDEKVVINAHIKVIIRKEVVKKGKKGDKGKRWEGKRKGEKKRNEKAKEGKKERAKEGMKGRRKRRRRKEIPVCYCVWKKVQKRSPRTPVLHQFFWANLA